MADERIENYQLIQTGENRLDVYVESLPEFFEEIKGKLKNTLDALFSTYLISQVNINIFLGLPEKHALDKMRRILRKVS